MCDFLLLCGSTVCRCCRSLLASASEVQSTRTVGSQYLVPCSTLPACAVPWYCFCLRWICNILSGAVSVHDHVPPWGLKSVCLPSCSRSAAVCLSLHSDRHVTLLAFLALVRQLLLLVVHLLPVSVPRALVVVAVGLVPAVAATTCRNQWRRDARVLGLSATLCSDDTHADLSLPPYCGSWVAFSLGCQPGTYESAPCVTWSVLGSPPLRSFHHCPVAGGH